MLIDPAEIFMLSNSAHTDAELSFGGSYPPGDNTNAQDGDDRCSRILEMIYDFVDDLLSENDSNTITEHLFDCSRCRDAYNAAFRAEEVISREWHKSVPLPSSFQTSRAIDRIMNAIPETQTASNFPVKRVHSRTRWMRFPITWNTLEAG